jgi:hypothetical protein
MMDIEDPNESNDIRLTAKQRMYFEHYVDRIIKTNLDLVYVFSRPGLILVSVENRVPVVSMSPVRS